MKALEMILNNCEMTKENWNDRDWKRMTKNDLKLIENEKKCFELGKKLKQGKKMKNLEIILNDW